MKKIPLVNRTIKPTVRPRTAMGTGGSPIRIVRHQKALRPRTTMGTGGSPIRIVRHQNVYQASDKT